MPTIDGIFRGIVVPELPWKRVQVEEKTGPNGDSTVCSECGGPVTNGRCERCGVEF